MSDGDGEDEHDLHEDDPEPARTNWRETLDHANLAPRRLAAGKRLIDAET